ncbi:MAG TPA: SPFH domain-containing protein [Phycisphaerales bacterium]|nr:SPFH domain-containing protein [Phycisphaerales bacterium]
MTQTPTNPPGGGGPGDDPFLPAPTEMMPVEEPRRAASLSLRSDDARQWRAASMDAANKSLADALRITYRLLQVVMLALVALFVFSGFQQVTEGESGVRVTLGKVTGDKLEPGFRFSLPYPLGEIVKVQTGQRRLDLDESFWFHVDPANRGKPLSQLGFGAGSLKPGTDNSILTAEGNIAHVRLSVVYRRDDPADFLGNVNPEFEESILRSSVERATVRAVSTVTIDELLKRARDTESTAAASTPATPTAPTRESGLEARIRRLSQESLDALHSGLIIEQISINDATPPLRVRQAFAQVQTAVSVAETARLKAEQERTNVLNEAAGSAHHALLDLIDAYERDLELGHKAEAEQRLTDIAEILDGKRDGRDVTIAGKTYSDIHIAGRVARLMNAAAEYRSSVVTRAQAASKTFVAKREQYRSNPSVFLATEWVDAYRRFMSGETVETFWAPPGTQTMTFKLTSDPRIAREIEAAQKKRETESNWRRTEAMHESAVTRAQTSEDTKLRQQDQQSDDH